MKPSKDLDEQIDEILWSLTDSSAWDLIGINQEQANALNEQLSGDRAEAKQAITSLIKELVAEAKPPAIDTSSRIKLYADDEGQMWYDRGQNDTIARFEQNLLKALEEL